MIGRAEPKRFLPAALISMSDAYIPALHPISSESYKVGCSRGKDVETSSQSCFSTSKPTSDTRSIGLDYKYCWVSSSSAVKAKSLGTRDRAART